MSQKGQMPTDAAGKYSKYKTQPAKSLLGSIDEPEDQRQFKIFASKNSCQPNLKHNLEGSIEKNNSFPPSTIDNCSEKFSNISHSKSFSVKKI